MVIHFRYVDVLRDLTVRLRSRNDGHVLLDEMTQQDLRGTLLVAVGDHLHGRVVEHVRDIRVPA